MTTAQQRPETPSCPECGYGLGGLSKLKCPECGYELEAEELAGADRRRVFLELTRWSQYSWIPMVLVIVLLMLPVLDLSMLLLYLGFGVVFLAPGLVLGSWLAARRVPRAYRPLVRRMWRLSLFWLQLPWLLPLAVTLAVYVVVYGFDRVGLWEYSQMIAEYLQEGLDGRNWWMLGLLFAVGMLAGSIVWRRRWRGLAAVSGLPARTAGRVGLGLAVRAAILPPAIIFATIGILAGLIAVLDRVRPNWW